MNTLFDDLMEQFLSLLSEETVAHFATARREFLLGVKTCVNDRVDNSLERMDAHVEGARKRRAARAEQAAENTTRITIEEEEDAATA